MHILVILKAYLHSYTMEVEVFGLKLSTSILCVCVCVCAEKSLLEVFIGFYYSKQA